MHTHFVKSQILAIAKVQKKEKNQQQKSEQKLYGSGKYYYFEVKNALHEHDEFTVVSCIFKILDTFFI